MRWVIALVAALAVSIGSTTRADDDDKAWKNTPAIVTTHSAVKVTLQGGAEIDLAYPVVHSVQADGDRVYVRTRTGQDGYVEKSKLVPLRGAMALFSERIKNNPDDADAYYRRGLTHDGTGDLKAAMGDLDEAIRRDAKQAEYYLGRALVRRPVNSSAAVTDLAEAIRLDPKNPYAWHIQGRMWDSTGKLNEAVADQTEAIRLMPKFANAIGERANLWMRLNQLVKAIDDYTELIALDKRNGRYYAERGKCRELKHDVVGAVTDYTTAIQLNPNDGKAFEYRGTFFYQLKEYADAVKDLTVAVNLEPKNLLALNNLAWILATCPDDKLRDGAKAQKLAKAAGDLVGWKQAFFMGTYAAACAEVGQFDEAIKWQEKALAGVPEYHKKQFSISLDLYRSHKPKRD